MRAVIIETHYSIKILLKAFNVKHFKIISCSHTSSNNSLYLLLKPKRRDEYSSPKTHKKTPKHKFNGSKKNGSRSKKHLELNANLFHSIKPTYDKTSPDFNSGLLIPVNVENGNIIEQKLRKCFEKWQNM